MNVFTARHFLRHISMPLLQEFTEAHVLGPRLHIDWTQPEETLPEAVADAVDALDADSRDPLEPDERSTIEQELLLWHDDLRRAHLMSNALALQEFRRGAAADAELFAAFAERDERESALWMLTYRDQAFRDAELHLAFQARTEGRYWKKHRIQPGLTLTRDRRKLEVFCQAVAQLYRKDGAGKGAHAEISERTAQDSIQLTLYVEGPVTALTQYQQNTFKRLTTRIALETALVYHPTTGVVETIVLGGARNHDAVLQLFGEHVIGQPLAPDAIERKRYRLNALRDGLMEPTIDWSLHDVETVRLRRALFCPIGCSGVEFEVKAPEDKFHDDALRIARESLAFEHAFETEYRLEGATVVVYRLHGKGRGAHFSFNLYASGASNLKHLPARNQVTADVVLKALHVIDAEQVGG